MEGYTYASNSGARLTIDGGVTVNATGGNGENHNGGTGIRVGWGTIGLEIRWLQQLEKFRRSQ